MGCSNYSKTEVFICLIVVKRFPLKIHSQKYIFYHDRVLNITEIKFNKQYLPVLHAMHSDISSSVHYHFVYK